jgi:hypothetical protein
MGEIVVDVTLPNALSVDVTSPTQALAANVIIPGPQGPRGEDGVGTLINNLSGNLFFTGADGVSILATGNNILVVSGNSGYFQKLIDNLFLQTQTISGNLEILGSGFFTSGIKVGTGTVFIEPGRILINGDPVVTRSGLNDVSGYFQSSVNSLSGTVTGNYVTKFNGQFTNRPTVNGTGILLSGEAARLPDTILYTTGNQIKSGRLIIGDDPNSIVDPNSQYTLSLQTNSPRTWLEILNNSGAGQGVFFGIEGNNFEQYNWQGGDIVFFTSENVSDGVARLTIKNDGKVGIGTRSPSEKLEVVGNIKVSNSGFFNSGIQIGTGGVYIEPNRILIDGDPVITRSGLNAVSGYFESENTIGYSYVLPVGNDNYFVTYPSVLNSDPRSINCIFQNNVDNVIYYYSIGNINKTGFYINFSDQIDNTGYALNINIKK